MPMLMPCRQPPDASALRHYATRDTLAAAITPYAMMLMPYAAAASAADIYFRCHADATFDADISR